MNGNVAARTYYSDMTMTLEPWSATAPPSELRMKFVFKNSKENMKEGRYCVQLVYNGWLINTNCDSGIIFIDVFQLPVSIYQYPNSGCDVSYDVADYLYFTRNFARQINIVNREIDLEQEDGPMICRFD